MIWPSASRASSPSFRPGPPRGTARGRLALLSWCVFTACGAGLLAITYLLVRQTSGGFTLRAPGPPGIRFPPGASRLPAGNFVTELGHLQQVADLHTLLIMSAIALALMAAVSGVLGWLFAGRVLRPLELAVESQRGFVANASHELRTPLARLKTVLQVALSDPDPTVASLRHAQERAIASERQLEALIDALLALAEGERAIEHPEPVDLAAATHALLAVRAPEIERLGLRVDSDLDRAWTAGNEQLLGRLVSNLLDNAVGHNAPHGWVSVRTTTHAGRAIVSLTNSGPVIPARELDRLKQPFQQLAAGRAGGDGHGLGLSIIAAIATTHGGALHLEPRPEGGLDARVELPACAA